MKRHFWKYVREYELPRVDTFAKCLDCGVRTYYRKRPRKRPSWTFGKNTDEQVFVVDGGEPTTVRPPCRRRAR